jgi:hypothetical protein
VSEYGSIRRFFGAGSIRRVVDLASDRAGVDLHCRGGDVVMFITAAALLQMIGD